MFIDELPRNQNQFSGRRFFNFFKKLLITHQRSLENDFGKFSGSGSSSHSKAKVQTYLQNKKCLIHPKQKLAKKKLTD